MKNIWVRIALGVVSLAIVGCNGSGGDAIHTASAEAHKAADQFTTMAAGSERTGQPPRVTDPAVAALLNKVMDTHVLAGPTPPMSELDSVNDWLLSVAHVGQVYILAGSGATSFNAPMTPQLEEQADRNVVSFAPELGPYIDAQLAIMGTEAAMVSKDLAANPSEISQPNIAKGLQDIRGGTARTLTGVLTTLATPGLTDDWRRARMRALLAIAPAATQLLEPPAKAGVRDTANQVAAALTDPQLKADLGRFAAMVSPGGPAPGPS